MKSKLMTIGMLVLVGCQLLPNVDYRYYPAGSDASILLSYEYLSHTSTQVDYSIRVASFNYNNDLYYDAGDYDALGDGIVSITSIEGVNQSMSEASSTIFLIDQSDGWVAIDPHNMRTKGINKFLEDIQSPNSVLFGAFASSGILGDSPVEYSSSDFTTQWLDRDFLFDLPKRAGGTSPLYKAIDAALDRLATNSALRKNLVLLIHNKDDGVNSPLVSSLITKAISNSIKINFIIVGDDPPISAVWKLSNQTNGIVANCSSEWHLVTIMHHLERLLNGTVYVSNVKIKFEPTVGNINSGDSFENTIKIIDHLSNYEFNPMKVEIEIP